MASWSNGVGRCTVTPSPCGYCSDITIGTSASGNGQSWGIDFGGSLTIDASADPNITEIPVHVTAVRDVVIWSNFWIAAALLLAYPIYCGIRHHAFERARWLESDYSPYSSSDDSDDDDD
jgi:hypothetical protein